MVRRTIIASALCTSVLAQAGPNCQIHTGSTGIQQDSPCVPIELRHELEARAHAYHMLRPSAGRGAFGPYLFYPQAGTIGEDLVFTNFVDLDESGGLLDFACGDVTYNGHAGHDSVIRSWTEQAIGVPVFAVADGVVMFTNDGEFDQNTSCNGSGNFIIIDHGFGREGWYFHLRNGSVALSPGDPVIEGQQIGFTASSGCSTYPHLHFESRQGGATFEPFAGVCRPGDSGWSQQPDPMLFPAIQDFGITTTDPGLGPGLPEPLPRDAVMDINTPRFYIWTQLTYLPPNSNWRIRLDNPSGVQVWDSGTVGFGNSGAWRSPWFWWFNDVIQFSGITGEWTVRFDINGQTLIEAPVLATDGTVPGFNRPPSAITASFEPTEPDAEHAIFCVVDSSTVYEDPDWDVVRYRYSWEIDGQIVRDVTTAAKSDAIPRSTGAVGQTVRCTVTATDGINSAAPVVATATIGPVCSADLAPPTGVLNFFDLGEFLTRFNAQDPSVDFAAPFGVWNFFDLGEFLTLFNQGCP